LINIIFLWNISRLWCSLVFHKLLFSNTTLISFLISISASRTNSDKQINSFQWQTCSDEFVRHFDELYACDVITLIENVLIYSGQKFVRKRIHYNRRLSCNNTNLYRMSQNSQLKILQQKNFQKISKKIICKFLF